MITKHGLAVTAAGVGVSLFVGYCFYFDYKRRSAPDFKAQLIAKRKKQKMKSLNIEFPDITDSQAMQQFFFNQLRLGEELLDKGNVKDGVVHLSLAIMLTGQARQLLDMLESTLPPSTYQRLIAELPRARERVRQAFASQRGGQMPAAAGASPMGGNVLEELE